ncbi:MAG: DUF4474 domain-containing protein [Clostridia bacterium]|nr:DUF4474 domain-containing protein [Clostridia bacterium]
MKKIIATALSILVGAFGYTIVDQAIEDRVTNLEYAVSSLEAVVESYHNAPTTKSPITTQLPTTAVYHSDMSFSGLSSMGYNVFGSKPYIYNDDKDPNSLQKDFGYNPSYDLGASLIDFKIETEKIDFEYDGKQYRIQFWKGQYISGDIGTVGGEVGVYTRPKDSVGEHYNCPAEDDWLKMEMTVFWDEFNNGEYLPQLTRHYDYFWWATGFVDGRLDENKNCDKLRILCRITFESDEQAIEFDKAMANNGFAKVGSFSPYEANTYKRSGTDVIFLWQ